MTASPPELRGAEMSDGQPEDDKQKSTLLNKTGLLTRLDWAVIRQAHEEEGRTLTELAVEYGVTPQRISIRKRREGWGGGPSSKHLTPSEELLTMRSMRVIGRILRSIERKYEAADGEVDKRDKGADARAIQSITRATETAAATKRKNKAKDLRVRDAQADRDEVARLLESIERKADQSGV